MVLALIAVLTTSAAGFATPSTGHTVTRSVLGVDVVVSLRVNGVLRTFDLHEPSRRPTKTGFPVLLVFHGHGETDQIFETATGYDRFADVNNILVVYPQGVGNSWNDGRGNTVAQATGVNDVAFVAAIVHWITTHFQIDTRRVYATGFSNGGIFTQRLGCALSGTIAAIATVAGPLAVSIAATCRSARPISVYEVQGTIDPVVPWSGGTVISGVGGVVLSQAATVKLWAHRDSCSGHSRVTTLPAAPHDGTSVVVTALQHCAGGTAVDAVSVVGGVHTWPGASANGTAGYSYRATAAIWRFLRQFSLPSPG